MDFGNVEEVNKKDVRYLAKRFAIHPAFALRGCLDYVRPVDGTWTFEAMERFYDHIRSFPGARFLAKVTNLNLIVSCSHTNF